MVGKTATPPELSRRGGGRKTSSHASFAGKRLVHSDGGASVSEP